MAIPIAENLFKQTPQGPRLLAGRDRETGRLAFPMPSGPDAARFDVVELGPEGRLWSYTIQRFPPKSPPFRGTEAGAFRPYAVGYVELPGEIIVETRIETDSFNGLRVGLPMRLVLAPFGAKSPTGEDLVTYAFAPA